MSKSDAPSRKAAERGESPRAGSLAANAPGPVRRLAGQALSRVAGAPLVEGNAVELLVDARANFDAWLAAIRAARESILMENYIFADDAVSREIREALAERAAAGVMVRVVRDWLGCFGQSSDGFWKPLRAAGGEVRTYNPLRWSAPFSWLSRDHRKLLVVDAEVGFVSGVCVSATWLGDEARHVSPWRDTGIALRGPALGELALAFAENWAELGSPLSRELGVFADIPRAGSVGLRVIATRPATTGLYRLDHMIAALAQRSLWLADAYFMATPPYVQALAAAARDGVDVRLLLPGTSDVPLVGALSRAGYRRLLEAGVRVFEWNGSMMHAKTAVADSRWARVGSTNLNVASFYGNAEIDVAIEDEAFARHMESQYEADLENATEILLSKRRPRRIARPRRRGSASRAAAGAARLANAVGGAITDSRVLASSERRILLAAAAVLSILAAVALRFPKVLAWPLAIIAIWLALGLLVRSLSHPRR
jgi:cardiolipin synthase